MKKSTAERVYEIAKPIADELNLDIWDIVFKKEGSTWVLRIYIDKDSGIGIDDCVDMTKTINPVLDKLDPIPQEYTLEVSSPGINRKLSKPGHFEAFIGAPVTAKLIRPLEDGTKELTGQLIKEDNGCIELQLDDETSVTIDKKEYSSVNLNDDEI